MQKTTDRLIARIEREDPGAWEIVRIENSPSGRGHKHLLIRSRRTGLSKRLTCEADWDHRVDPRGRPCHYGGASNTSAKIVGSACSGARNISMPVGSEEVGEPPPDVVGDGLDEKERAVLSGASRTEEQP